MKKLSCDVVELLCRGGELKLRILSLLNVLANHGYSLYASMHNMVETVDLKKNKQLIEQFVEMLAASLELYLLNGQCGSIFCHIYLYRKWFYEL